jgi:putative transposase
MKKTFKFRLFPSKQQRRLLDSTLEECRWLYNRTLQERRDVYEQKGISLTNYHTDALIPLWKATERPSLSSVHSQILQQVGERVNLAFQAFWRRCKAGQNPGYPRFKSKNRYDSFTFKQSGFMIVDGAKLQLSKIGKIKIVMHRLIEGKIKRLTICRSGTGKWYACFSTEIDAVKKQNTCSNTAIGIDVGISKFAVFSDGSEIKNPRFMASDQKKISKLQRQIAKIPKNSKNSKLRLKKRKALSFVFEKVVNKRNDWLHKKSRDVINSFNTICIEDLDIDNMKQNGWKSINRSINDVAWRKFRDLLSYKAEEAGVNLVLVNPKNTTRECSGCGEMVFKPLDQRVHSCPHCGLEMDRDLNAAINILRRGLSSLAKLAEGQ